ncbi:hypothetical protein [Streptomyces sp. NBC_00385]|uniref:hypothetical protein n=1 Tax=Streptomyces sp. NBC_00385 TaxID=2975733 RepID=UPI002DD9D2F8|nr:hypothetical protein [Streptomyces sp. NBC_00385]WRZ03612.1 hypothetical protein OG959_09765 [Streptomyces sp. NBC_00385]
MDSAAEAPAAPTISHKTWQQHIPVLAAAADGIKQASDSWNAASNSSDGACKWSIDGENYPESKVKRDAEAWKHVEVFLDHGPEVLAGVRAAACGSDYVNGPISEDLGRLRGIDTSLERAAQIRDEWDQVLALMDASQPGSRELYAGQAEKIRNSEGWQFAAALSDQGPALARASDYLANRNNADRPPQAARAQVALARSTPGKHGTPTASPTAPPASHPPPPRRSR